MSSPLSMKLPSTPLRLLAGAALLPLQATAASLAITRTMVNELTSAGHHVGRDPLNRAIDTVRGRARRARRDHDAEATWRRGVDAPFHVVVVGAGFAGLQTARALMDDAEDVDLRVTLLDRHNYHLFQPLLYQVATAGLDPQDIGHAVRNVLKGSDRVRFRLGDVVGMDLDARALLLRPTAGDEAIELPYDALVLAAGAVPADYGIPGIAEHAFTLKSMQDAVALRNHLLGLFERAELEPELVDDGAFTFVIGGGGPTGVELAGAIAELTDVVLRDDHPALDLDRVRIVLAEPLDALLNGYSPASQEATRRALEERGVEVRTGLGIEEVHADHVVFDDGSALRTRTLIWAAGVKASPLAEALGAETTRGGRVVVDEHLRLPGRPEVMVVGDLAGATDRDGELLPQLSPVAMQQGRHVAEVIVRGRRGLDAGKPFRYVDKGTMATIGRADAVAELPLGIKLRGFPAWVAWLAVHLVFLVGWRNRASTLVNWAWNYVTWDRGSRVLFDQDQAPGAIDDLFDRDVPLAAGDAA